MREFFNNYLSAFKFMFVFFLFMSGLFGPAILAVVISDWFWFLYIVTIPSGCACIDYLMNSID